MTIPALLIGGPKDGEIYALRAPLPFEVVFDPVAVRFMKPEEPVDSSVRRPEAYVRERVALFGWQIAVYVHEGVPRELRNKAAAAYLLSDTAKRLIGGQA